jgi:hypothetical protein
LAGAAGPNCEEQEARRIVIEAALSHLEEGKARDREELSGLYDHLAGHYRNRLASLHSADGNQEEAGDHDRYVDLSRETLRIERETAVRLRNEGRINDEILRRIERELDLSESVSRWPTNEFKVASRIEHGIDASANDSMGWVFRLAFAHSPRWSCAHAMAQLVGDLRAPATRRCSLLGEVPSGEP